MGFQINYGTFAFAVPGAVVDHYIRLAGDKELRLLLFYLRHAGENIPLEQAAAFLHLEPEQAEEAFRFWVQADVLRQGLDPASMPFTVPAAAPPSPPQPEAAHDVISSVGAQRSSKEIKLDPSEIAAEIEKSQELTDLFALSEKRIGRPINHMEQRSLLWLHQYLNIPSEVILMLLEYCISIDKYSISYAESIAISWQTQGIVTLSQAETEIRRMTQEHTFETDIRKRFEMKRAPTTKQRSYLDLWQKAGYPMELIQYAYEITVENIEKLDFKYINTILEGWAADGVRDVASARQLREKPSPVKKKNTREKPLTQREVDEMNDYLSVVNRFKEENQA